MRRCASRHSEREIELELEERRSAGLNSLGRRLTGGFDSLRDVRPGSDYARREEYDRRRRDENLIDREVRPDQRVNDMRCDGMRPVMIVIVDWFVVRFFELGGGERSGEVWLGQDMERDVRDVSSQRQRRRAAEQREWQHPLLCRSEILLNHGLRYSARALIVRQEPWARHSTRSKGMGSLTTARTMWGRRGCDLNFEVRLPEYRKQIHRIDALFSNPIQGIIGPLVPEPGFEPGRPCGQWILSPLRLPFRHSGVWAESIALSVI